jgi:ABC-type polysaccharide/polyol phosphate export permease
MSKLFKWTAILGVLLVIGGFAAYIISENETKFVILVGIGGFIGLLSILLSSKVYHRAIMFVIGSILFTVNAVVLSTGFALGLISGILMLLSIIFLPVESNNKRVHWYNYINPFRIR